MVVVIPSATRTSSAATTSAPTTEAICPPADPHSDPPGRASTDLCAEASYRSKGRTAQEHERRPSSAQRLKRSSGARGATTARAAGGGTGSRARASKLAQGRRSQTAARGAHNCPAVTSAPPLSPRPAGERADRHAGGMQPHQGGAPFRLRRVQRGGPGPHVM
jgi:hypothetical protein